MTGQPPFPQVPDVLGFGAGTRFYRSSYAVGELLETTAKRLGSVNLRICERQRQLAHRIGDVRVIRRQRPLITRRQVAHVSLLLEPGDLILVRQTWYLSNLAMPGYWKHSGIHMGTEDQRRQVFDDARVRAWVRSRGIESGDFEDLLRAQCPRTYHASEAHDDEGSPVQVIEATSEGVCFTSLGSMAAVDSLAVLRPRLDPVDKARALSNAFAYVGRPYDYLFDFSSDEQVICSELVYRAYHPRAGQRGLDLAPRRMAGRYAMPTNDIARHYALRYATDRQQLDFVEFLDGRERAQKAVPATEPLFRNSWRRPAWDPLTRHLLGSPSLTRGSALS